MMQALRGFLRSRQRAARSFSGGSGGGDGRQDLTSAAARHYYGRGRQQQPSRPWGKRNYMDEEVEKGEEGNVEKRAGYIRLV